MLHKVLFTFVHVATHVLLYAIPRAVWVVCVWWPQQVLAFVFGAPLSFCNAYGERRVRILGPVSVGASSAPATTRERLGITEAHLANPALHHSRTTEKDAAWLHYSGPLYNGHVHTILGAFRPPLDLRAPQREVVPSYDGNPTCLDWWVPTPAETAAAAAMCASAEGMRVRALVVVLPGLTGSSKEYYLRRMARQLLAANMAVCVLNARGVADTPLEKPQIFSAVFTKDLRYMMENYFTREKVEERLAWAVQSIAQPNTSKRFPILGLAFSLGGLILTNYVSEQGEANQESGFDAVFTVTSPHNVNDGAEALRSPTTNFIYGPSFYSGLRAYYERHKEMIQHLPGVNKDLLFRGPHPVIDQLRSVQDFDEYITGPHFGFAGAEAYYSYANNFRRLHHSRTPQMCLVAANDPVCGAPQPDPLWLGVIEKHRAGLVYVEMPVGGHLGFLGCPFREWVQAPNEMENFLLRSMTHFIETADDDDYAANTGNGKATVIKTRPKRVADVDQSKAR
jgi:predicted alpha/beta-fold hydrolase